LLFDFSDFFNRDTKNLLHLSKMAGFAKNNSVFQSSSLLMNEKVKTNTYEASDENSFFLDLIIEASEFDAKIEGRSILL